MPAGGRGTRRLRRTLWAAAAVAAAAGLAATGWAVSATAPDVLDRETTPRTISKTSATEVRTPPRAPWDRPLRAALTPPAPAPPRPAPPPSRPAPPAPPPDVTLVGTMTGDGPPRAVLRVGPRDEVEVRKPGEWLDGLPAYQVRSVSAGRVELVGGGREVALAVPDAREPFIGE